MDYDFNQLQFQPEKTGKKGSGKMQKLLLAVLIFFSLFAIREFASANPIIMPAHSQQLAKPAEKIFVENFSNYANSESKKQEPAQQSESNPASFSESAADANNNFLQPISAITNFIFSSENKKEPVPSQLFLNGTPQNLILIVMDGGGGYYISPELTPNLLAISKHGFFTADMRTLIPSTTESHTIIFSGLYNSSYNNYTDYLAQIAANKTIFDSAKKENYSLFAIMGTGDSPELIGKMDAALYDSDNDFHNFRANLKLAENLSSGISSVFSSANNLSAYSYTENIYSSYNSWVKDSVKAVLQKISGTDEKFILVVNFPGLDKGGHENFNSYAQIYKSLDSDIGGIFNFLIESHMLNSTAFAVTADHGMQLAYSGRGAHANIYTEKTLRVPFLLISPDTEPQISTIPYTNDNIAPTLLRLLNLPFNWSISGFAIGEIFSNKLPADIGILNATYESRNVVAFAKNYVNSAIEDEICLNASSKQSYAIACANFSVLPFEEKQFLFSFPFSSPGIYNSSVFLSRADNNPKNDAISLKIKTGPMHDLGIDKIYYTQSTENPQKFTVKVKIANNGDFTESGLALSGTIGNETREYGPYTSDIKNSKTISSTWTLNQTGDLNVTFKITGYENFALDSEEENNIISTYIHIDAVK